MRDRRLREEMVERVRVAVGSVSEAVLQALLDVPRHRFLPEVDVKAAYRDDAIVTKRDVDGTPISSSSQPTIMAIMLDQLDMRPGDRVLEIGAGTGYNAALMEHLGGRVVTLDIDLDTVERARANLGRSTVTVVQADGALGYPEGAPYDRIIATVGTWDLLPAWTSQLAPGGRIVIPLDLGGTQCSVAFERLGDRWESRSVVLCGFMRMRGCEAGPEVHTTVDGDLRIMVPWGGSVPAQLSSWLASAVPYGDIDIDREFPLWLGVHSPGLFTLSAPVDDSRLHGAWYNFHDYALTFGLLSSSGVAFLGDFVFGGGPDGAALASSLISSAASWDSAGRPSVADLHVTAVPLSSPASGVGIAKRHNRFLLSWERA